MCSPGEVAQYIGELGISKVALKERDIQAILETIVADGKAEKCESMEGSVLYRAVVPLLASAGLSKCPCGVGLLLLLLLLLLILLLLLSQVCPVVARCGQQGSVTPATCSYFRDWLEAF